MPQINVAEAVAKIAAPPPAIAIPEPVADEKAQTQTIATVTEMAEALAPITMEDLGVGDGDGDSLVDRRGHRHLARRPTTSSPSRRSRCASASIAPVYPDGGPARPGIEGTVLVRVLVGKDGKVKDVIYIDGPEALQGRGRSPAPAPPCSARRCMDHKPVEVWVMMPVTFKLRN